MYDPIAEPEPADRPDLAPAGGLLAQLHLRPGPPMDVDHLFPRFNRLVEEEGIVWEHPIRRIQPGCLRRGAGGGRGVGR